MNFLSGQFFNIDTVVLYDHTDYLSGNMWTGEYYTSNKISMNKSTKYNPSDWKCLYCGGLQNKSFYNCKGCNAPRF